MTGNQGGIKRLSNLSMTTWLEIGSVTLDSNIMLSLQVEASSPIPTSPLLDSTNDKARISDLD